MTMKMFMRTGEVIFQARVSNFINESSYPLDQVMFSDVTLGSYTDIEPGMTVFFGSTQGKNDEGIQRIRKAATVDTLYIGRTSQGLGYGQIDPQGISWISVLNLRQVWPKVPIIDIDEENVVSTVYKDADIVFSDQTLYPPPVANTGPGTQATIDGSNVITVEFPAGGINQSFVTAPGATITTYLWDVKDGTITIGTSASAVITATFPTGFRYVSLTVTDSNGKTHTSYCPVYADDLSDSDYIHHFSVTRQRITAEGQELDVDIMEDISEGLYPDNTLVMISEGEPSSPTDRSHMTFIGWHHSGTEDLTGTREGFIRKASIQLLDVAGKMNSLHSFTQEIRHVPNSQHASATPSHWGVMPAPNMDLYNHYLLQWHSNALDLVDFIWSGTGTSYAFHIRGSNAGTLWDQVSENCGMMNPQYKLTCNRKGQLKILEDPMTVVSNARTSIVQKTITEDEWTNIRIDYERYPKFFWLWGGAVLAGNDLDSNGNEIVVFCKAPGLAPGIGWNEKRRENGITPGQQILNDTTGNILERENSPYKSIRVDIVGSDDFNIEPADMTWVQLIMGQDVFPSRRGVSFLSDRGLPTEINITRRSNREAEVKKIEMAWELEVIGSSAATVLPESNAIEVDTGLPDDYFDDNPGDIVVADPVGIFYGNMKAYILWNRARVMRTWDLREASPTWEFVDTGVTGDIFDAQYVHVSGSTIGVWLMTSDAIWWCADIMATTPSWSNVLPITTVRAAQIEPDSGASEFRSMANWASGPGFLIVAVSPMPESFTNDHIYLQAYFWKTADYGQNWTMLNMTDYLVEVGEESRAFCHAGRYSMEMARDESGTIYCVRQAPRYGTKSPAAVFISKNFGVSWDRRYLAEEPGFPPEYRLRNAEDSRYTASILHPFPSPTDPSWIVNLALAADRELHMSTREWVDTTTQMITNPTGYVGPTARWRVNSHSNDPNHVICWWKRSGETQVDLLESYDKGQTWTFLLEGIGEFGPLASDWNTPNGWPADPNEWVLVRQDVNFVLTGQSPIHHTLDNFATLNDKEGNLETLLGGVWADDTIDPTASGFALPRVGPNA